MHMVLDTYTRYSPSMVAGGADGSDREPVGTIE